MNCPLPNPAALLRQIARDLDALDVGALSGTTPEFFRQNDLRDLAAWLDSAVPLVEPNADERERCRQTGMVWPRIVDNLLAGHADARVRIGEEENLVRRALLRSAGPPKGIAGTPGCFQCGCGEWLFANHRDLRGVDHSVSGTHERSALVEQQHQTTPEGGR